jgi:hypothetical protein
MIDRNRIAAVIREHDGILPLAPALVARTWMRPGRRLGLADEAYDVGERGSLCERWLGSTTPAANAVTFDGEGISEIDAGDGERIRLDHAVAVGFDLLAGEDYAAAHDGLQRLAKIFDYGERVPFHIHPPSAAAARAGLHSKDEAYYFPPTDDLGPHPESFFGVHPSLGENDAAQQLVRHLEEWRGEEILAMSRGYRLFAEDGYYIPSGVLHAPGTALTIELQEDSDAMAFLQAQCGPVELSRDLLLGPLAEQDRVERGAAAILDWVDWDLNRVPDFYNSFRIRPRVIHDGDGVEQTWLFWGGTRFVGKRIRLEPGAAFVSAERGAYSLLVWSGDVEIDGVPAHGGTVGEDEFFLTADRARSVTFRNAGTTRAEIISFFGPDLNPDAPTLEAAP